MNLNELLGIAKQHVSGLSELSDPDIRLEQAEFIKKDRCWEIVVSYLVANTNKRISSSGFGALGSHAVDFQYYRIYKKLKINENKEIMGMYMFNEKG